jgi:dTDP-6-deoxy-L-talose 4-dehydrogenase (NAD+)
MKVLVTGATGFVGNAVMEELIKDGNLTIIATSRDQEKAKKLEWYNKVKYIPMDFIVGNSVNYYDYFQQPTHLIHLAWEGLPNYKDLFHIEKNLYVNYFFIKNLIQNGLQNVSITGTCFEYGMINGCLSENLQVSPQTPYGIAKDSLRKFVDVLQLEKEFSFKWIRLFYMYGKGQNEKSLLSQLEQALQNKSAIFNMSGGEQLRDYLPIEDVAKHIIAIALQDNIQGIINCCSGIPISVRNLVENFLALQSEKITLNLGYYPYPDYEPMAFWGNNKKLNNIYATKR